MDSRGSRHRKGKPMAPDMMVDAHAPLLEDAKADQESPSLVVAALETPDDIPDISVPETLTVGLETLDAPAPRPGADWHTHEALLHGFMGHFLDVWKKEAQQRRAEMDSYLTHICATVERWSHVLATANEHALYQFSDAMLKGQDHGRPLPYSADIPIRSPNGFAVTLHVTKSTQQELLSELKDLTDWCASVGCTPA